jgi:hypothetical protein
MNEKRSDVGLLVIMKNKKGERVAILQVRGIYNSEENRLQHYAGGCQPTVYGGVKDGETEMEALLRESIEELGVEFAKLIAGKELKKVGEFKNDMKNGVFYTVELPQSFLKIVSLGPDSSGLRPVSLEEVLQAKDLSQYKSGVPEGMLAIFEDTKIILQKLLSSLPL